MACLLDFYGKTLDIDSLEKQIRIGKCMKRYRDLNTKSVTKEYSFLSKFIRGTYYESISEQSKVVFQFLNRHKRKLLSIVNHPDIETAILNFGVRSTPKTRAKYAQSMYLSFEFLQLCAELHIEIEITMFHMKINV